MRHLGVLRGQGMLSCGGVALGAAAYEIDGFRLKPGEIVGSGEIRMAPAALNNAFGRRELELATDDGRLLTVRFSGSRRDMSASAAHADIIGGLPTEDEWQR